MEAFFLNAYHSTKHSDRYFLVLQNLCNPGKTVKIYTHVFSFHDNNHHGNKLNYYNLAVSYL